MDKRPFKTEAITKFLTFKARPELAQLYSPEMEVQCNVAQGNGERIDKEFRGKQYSAWTDGDQTWKSFRIPLHANTEPEYTDVPISFDLAKHTEGIGLTGWNWVQKKSMYVAFDFDAILGHSDKHTAKLTDVELNAVKQAAYAIPWVTILKSTSGNGLHLYVFLEPVETLNHTEHAALARSILGKMSALTGFDFDSKVDNCGGVLWLWHSKFDKAGGVDGEGLKVLKQGTKLPEVPMNWRDHLNVMKGARRKVAPGFIEESKADWFEELCGQHPRVQLDEGHKKLITYLERKSMGSWWWDSDHHMLVCHTWDLKQAHTDLEMRGIFETMATGSIAGDQNAFAFPMRDGVWALRRHTPGVREHELWEQDKGGWTRCYLNREPDLKIAAKAYGGAEDENGAFEFQEAKVALTAAIALGCNIELHSQYHKRKASLKPHKDGRLIFEIDKTNEDQTGEWIGWVDKKTKWRKVLTAKIPAKYEAEVGNYDSLLRHLVSEGSDGDAGWALNVSSFWKEEPLAHIKLALKSLGNTTREVELIAGQCVMKRWTLVNRPFEPEYVGDRQWNRDAAQFTYPPSQDTDNLQYPTWMSLLNHIGRNLDPYILINKWAHENGIKTGGEYLLMWIASMIQFPHEPLPYLFFYGEQGTGKSTLHEAISLLMTRGVVKADSALISPSGFNGELLTAVLCVVEETDLRHNKTLAYNRIKDWVTGSTINIHTKGLTPFTAPNTTHWLQCANESEACPIFPGDTRITMMKVDKLDQATYIAKRDLMHLLKKEAPDFLATILKINIPFANDRLAIPVIETDEKDKAAKLNQTDLETFLDQQCHFVSGKMILLSEFYDRFKDWLDPERKSFWTRQKITRYMPPPVAKGRLMRDGAKHYYANISWSPPQPNDIPKPLIKVVEGERLVCVDGSAC